MIPIDIDVNGRLRTGVAVAPRTHLADVLRGDLNLTGTHLGCEHGVCGACTLMVDGRPVRSCLMLAVACHGAHVRTIEGFDDDPLMMRLRQAFSRHHALQCGYCTPGMLVTAYDIVRRLPGADAPRIREELSGNLCRCTGYMGIVAAIADVLAHDPPPARVQPLHRTASIALQSGPVAVTASMGASRPGTSAPPLAPMASVAGGTVLERDVTVSAPLDAVWLVLDDVRRVAACLPGASIDRQDGDVVHGSFAVAIGPMRVSFKGQAAVSYDRQDHAGTVTGLGADPISRSAAEGSLRFKVAEAGIAACVVSANLTYRLKGPLAQFGRPSLVATVIDGLLAVFARNVAAMAQGQAAEATAPLSGMWLLRRGVAAWIKRLFSRS